jgi:D-arabinose 1-dehydrogenase-like Zn-dependent alcohol dehydrogenase
LRRLPRVPLAFRKHHVFPVRSHQIPEGTDAARRADRLFWDGYQVQSTLVASKAQHNDMLEFSARHGIKPTIQVRKFEGSATIEDVFGELARGKVRYRAVLEF